ncbi:hypothetical protein C8R44DRAFT_984317 [Mycena epipterygia]|nr:hypothetical protein C8R44DRAFT_984317 [Mycena epipterygia]
MLFVVDTEPSLSGTSHYDCFIQGSEDSRWDARLEVRLARHRFYCPLRFRCNPRSHIDYDCSRACAESHFQDPAHASADFKTAAFPPITHPPRPSRSLFVGCPPSAASTCTSSSSGGGRHFLEDTCEYERQCIHDTERMAPSAAELLALQQSAHNTSDFDYDDRRGYHRTPLFVPPVDAPSSSGHGSVCPCPYVAARALAEKAEARASSGAAVWVVRASRGQHGLVGGDGGALSHSIGTGTGGQGVHYLLDGDAAPERSVQEIWFLRPARFHAHFYAQVWCTYRAGFGPIRDLPSFASLPPPLFVPASNTNHTSSNPPLSPRQSDGSVSSASSYSPPHSHNSYAGGAVRRGWRHMGTANMEISASNASTMSTGTGTSNSSAGGGGGGDAAAEEVVATRDGGPERLVE